MDRVSIMEVEQSRSMKGLLCLQDSKNSFSLSPIQ